MKGKRKAHSHGAGSRQDSSDRRIPVRWIIRIVFILLILAIIAIYIFSPEKVTFD